MQVNRWASSLDAKPSECSSLTYEIRTNILLQEMNAADEATEQYVQTLPGAVVPQVALEWSLLYMSSVTIQTVTWTNLQKFCGWLHGRPYKIIELAKFGDGCLCGNGCLLGGNTIQVMV